MLQNKTILTLLIIAAGFLINSCSKNDDAIVLSHKVKLESAENINNRIHLKWTQPYMHDFDSYVILRYEEIPGPFILEEHCYYWNGQYYCDEHYDLSSSIERVDNYYTLSYIDYDVPVANELYYRIVAIGDTILASNVIKVEMNDLDILNYYSHDIAYDKETNNLFIFTNEYDMPKTIYKYSISNKNITDSVFVNNNKNTNLSAGIKLSELNNNKYLAVWYENLLRLYDTKSMSEISYTYFTSYVSDVEFDANDHVFVSTNNDDVHSLNATDLSSITSLSFWDTGYLFFYNGSLLSIEKWSYPDYDVMRVNENGSLTHLRDGFKNIDALTGDFNYLNGYMCTESGEIYTFNFSYKGKIPASINQLGASFAFNDANYQVIQVNHDARQIKSYSLMPGFDLSETKSTLGWPIKCFAKKDGHLIVVSATSSHNPKKMIIEEF